MQNTIPLISVIMPVYNTEKYISEAIESILNQTYTNFEFLIFDDASTDKSVQIINSFKDKRIQLITKPQNTGYTNSLNMGLTMAKGEYIARMDSDDISKLNRLETQLNFMENNKDIAVCGSWFNILGSENIIKHPVYHDEIKMALLKYCSIGHPTVMIRNSFLKTHQLSYNPQMEPAEDYDLWVRISKTGKLHNLDEILLFYRLHSNQISNLKSDKQKKLSDAIQLNLYNQIIIQTSIVSNPRQLEDKNLEASFFVVLNKKLKQLKTLRENNETQNIFNSNLFNIYLQNVRKNLIESFFHDRRAYNYYTLKDLIFKSSLYLPYLKKIMFYKYIVKSIVRYK